MRVLFDTNIVLDLLLEREPFVAPAAGLVQLVERGELVGVLGATTVTTIFYLAEKARSGDEARLHVGQLLQLFEIAPVTRSILQEALQSHFDDFEDAVLHEAGRESGVDALVTRDTAGFRQAGIPVYRPSELLTTLAAARETKRQGPTG